MSEVIQPKRTVPVVSMESHQGLNRVIYQPKYADQAFQLLAKHNYTLQELSEHFEVSIGILNRWMTTFPDFEEAVKKGRDAYAAGHLEPTLTKRAMGYETTEKKIETFPDGSVKTTEISKHIPPDTSALIFWLVNRIPDRWKHVRHLQSTVDVKHSGVELNLTKLSPRELSDLRGLLEKSNQIVAEIESEHSAIENTPPESPETTAENGTE